MKSIRHTKSRVLAVFLCLCMVFTLLPMSAFAEEASVTLKVTSSAQNDSAERAEGAAYKTLSGALTKALDGDTIQLETDVTENTTAISINKSVTIKSEGDTKHTLTVKTLNISGSDKTVNLENLKITRTELNVPNDSGAGVYAIVAVGFNSSNALDSTTPTVNIKNCEISITGTVGQTGSDNIQTAALRVGSGTVTVENSEIKNTTTVTKVAAEAIQIDTASSSGDNATRSLTISGTSSIECTNGSGVLFTETVKNSTLTINGGTVKAKYCINYAATTGTSTVTVGSGVTLEGWSAVTVRGSGLTATFTNGTTIKCENKHTSGANNYAAFAFESGTGNTVTVDENSTLTCTGNNNASGHQYVASFYGEGEETDNNNKVVLKGAVTVTGNPNNLWFTHSQTDDGSSLFFDSQGNGNVIEIEGKAAENCYVVRDREGKINATSELSTAIDVINKDKGKEEKTGYTVEVGQNAPEPAADTQVEVPAGVTVDTTKNPDAAKHVKPADNVVVVYGVKSGSTTKDVSYKADSDSFGDLRIGSFGFNADAAKASQAINAALSEDSKTVSDVSANTMYAILNHRAAGDSLMVVVKKGNDVIYKEAIPDTGARAFYFTFPAQDNSNYGQGNGGSPAAKKLAEGEYKVGLYKASDSSFNNPLCDVQKLDIYKVVFKVVNGKFGVSDTEKTSETYVTSIAEANAIGKPDVTADTDYHTAAWGSGVTDESGHTITYTMTCTKDPVYTVTCDTATNGTVTATPNTDVKQGTQVTVTVTPNGNYTCDGVTVKGSGDDDVAVTKQADGTYVFTMPASNVTVSATFKAIPTVTGVTIGQTNPTVEVGKKITLTATVTVKDDPDNTLAKTVKWSSDAAEIATVDETTGEVTGVKEGSANITATSTADSGKSHTVTVTVTKKATTPTPPPSTGGGGSYTPTTTVKTENATNGNYTVSDKNAKAGDTVKVTPKANEGYVVDQVVVTDKNGNAVEVKDNGDGTYSFVMPEKATQPVTVKVTFKAEETVKISFADVPANAYYADAVAWAVEKGITNGTSATTFSPDASCTRAQIVTFLWRAAGSPEPSGSVNPFTDVDASSYYGKAVLWAIEKGITNGTSATTFSPDATCTRAQAVTFLYRYEGTPAASGSSFGDVANDAYYAAAVAWAVREEITNGTGANTFSPDNICTRGQIVTLLYRDMAE